MKRGEGVTTDKSLMIAAWCGLYCLAMVGGEMAAANIPEFKDAVSVFMRLAVTAPAYFFSPILMFGGRNWLVRLSGGALLVAAVAVAVSVQPELPKSW